jgi:helix-turn-helix protein
MPEKNSTAQSSQKSSGRESSLKNSPSDELSRFHCSWHWHFRLMTSCLAALIYDWGCCLSFKSGSFHPSVENIAKHFRCERKTVLRALEELVRRGWAEVVHKEAGKPVIYRFIDHDEWARNHPDCCVVKDTMPWEGQGDPLGQQLYAISGGLAKFFLGQMKALRKSGMPDEQIAAEFRIFLDRKPQKGHDWNSVFFRFNPYLRHLAKDLLEAAVAVDSTSGVSLTRDSYQSLTRDTPSPSQGTQVFECSF